MKSLTVLLSVLSLLACSHKGSVARATRHHFTNEVMLPITPVKDQGASSTCWIYAMLAVIETEHIGLGDSVNLSPDFVARAWLAQEGRRAFFSSDKQGAVSMRGVAPMTLTLLRQQGLVPYDSYSGESTDFDALARQLTQTAHHSPTLQAYEATSLRLLDDRIGALPRCVYMFGFQYSPRQFAGSVCREGEYTALTSVANHPYGERVVLEVPDNQTREEFLNLPIDSLVNVARRSLQQGHPVLWEGDTSEEGFSFSLGEADVPKRFRLERVGTNHDEMGKNSGETKKVADEMAEKRQHDFDTRRTTDDHCMALVGLARDERGRRWFVAKNSWGNDNPYGGLMYLSEDYLRLKTIALVVQSSQLKPSF